MPLADIMKRDGWDAAERVCIPCPEWLRKFGDLWTGEPGDILKYDPNAESIED